MVHGCEVIRCGGFDQGWAWRAALQLCLDRRSISGLDISDVKINDSLSDGFGVVAPGSAHGDGTLSNAVLENVDIPNFGIATTGRHGLTIRGDSKGGLRMKNSRIVDAQNSSSEFRILSE